MDAATLAILRASDDAARKRAPAEFDHRAEMERVKRLKPSESVYSAP